MRTTKRTTAGIAALALLATLTTACGGDSEVADGDGSTVSVAMYPNVLSTVALVVAQDQGMFEAEGITVETVDVLKGTDAIAGMLGGTTQFTYATPSVLIPAMAQGQEVLALPAWADQDYTLSVPADSDIESVEDLEGATIAVLAVGGALEFFANSVLEVNGLSPDDVEYIAAGPVVGQVAGLNNGEYDATVANPGSLQQLEANDVPMRILASALDGTAGDFGDNGIASMWATTADYAKSNPENTEAFCRAMVATSEWMADDANRDAGVAIFAETLNIDEASAGELWDQEHELYRASIEEERWDQNVEYALGEPNAEVSYEDSVYSCA